MRLLPSRAMVGREYLVENSDSTLVNLRWECAKSQTRSRLVEAILPVHSLPGKTAEAVAPNCTQISKVPGCKTILKNGGDDGTRTRGLCRDSDHFTRN